MVAVRPTLPAIAGVPGSRPYTGNNDGAATGQRAGTNEFIRQSIKVCPALHNLGSWVIRDQQSRPGILSVHATGRATNLSWLYLPDKRGIKNARPLVNIYLDAITNDANTLGIEYVCDYWPQKHGRAWRCDRQAWKDYTKHTVSGAPGGRWIHIELNTDMANNAKKVRATFRQVFGQYPQ